MNLEFPRVLEARRVRGQGDVPVMLMERMMPLMMAVALPRTRQCQRVCHQVCHQIVGVGDPVIVMAAGVIWELPGPETPCKLISKRETEIENQI